MSDNSVFEVVCLAHPLDYHLTGLATHRNSLYAGAADGSLRVYTGSPNDPDPMYKRVATLPKFAKTKSALTHLKIVPEWGALFSRTDDHIAVHDLATQKLHTLLPNTQGSSAYCVSYENSTICVAVKQCLRLFTWSLADGRISFSREHVVDVDVVVLEWVASQICVGMANGCYMYVEPLSGVVTNEIIVGPDGTIAPPGTPAPLTTKHRPGGRRDSDTSTGSASTAAATVTRLAVAVVSRGSLAPQPHTVELASPRRGLRARQASDADMSTHGGDGEMIITARGPAYSGVFVDLEGHKKPKGGRRISLSEPPSLLIVSPTHPYVLSVQPKALEVHNTTSAVLSQTIALPNVVTVAYCKETFDARRFAMEVFRAEEKEEEESNLSKSGEWTSRKSKPKKSLPPFDPEVLFVGHATSIFMLRMVPVVMQVAALCIRKPPEFEEALLLCELDPEGISEHRIQEIRTRFGYELFAAGDYLQALEHLYKSGESVKRTLSLYPDLLPGQVPIRKRFPVRMPVMSAADKPEATRALTFYLVKQRARLGCARELESGYPSSEDEELDEFGNSPYDAPFGSAAALHSRELVDTALLGAYVLLEEHWKRKLAALPPSLRDHRRSRSLNPKGFDEERSGVRTAAELSQDIARMAAGVHTLVSGRNCCYVPECARVLREHGKRDELLLLYQGRDMHKEALELLLTIVEEADGAVMAAEGEGRDAKEEHSALEDAVDAIVAYMCKLGGDQLSMMLEFVEPLLAVASDTAKVIRVFTTKRSRRVLPLNPSLVLAFMRGGSEGPVLSPAFIIEYLEFLIFELGDADPSRHDELLSRYLADTLALLKERGAPSPASSAQAASTKDSASRRSRKSKASAAVKPKVPLRPGFLVGGSDSDSDDGVILPKSVARSPGTGERGKEPPRYIRAAEESGPLGEARRVLLHFLRTSKAYSPATFLPLMPPEDLWEERAEMLKRVDQHEEVLRIYGQFLCDDKAAEAYCNEVYKFKDNNDIYSVMLQAYLSAGRLTAALDIMSRCHARLNPYTAIEMLSPAMPLYQVQPLLEALLSSNTQAKRVNQITRRLVAAEHLDSDLKLLAEEVAFVRLEHTSKCAHCEKRLGESAFAVYPDGTLMHYNCYLEHEHISDTSGAMAPPVAPSAPPPPPEGAPAPPPKATVTASVTASATSAFAAAPVPVLPPPPAPLAPAPPPVPQKKLTVLSSERSKVKTAAALSGALSGGSRSGWDAARSGGGPRRGGDERK